jgi:hypothetical protein
VTGAQRHQVALGSAQNVLASASRVVPNLTAPCFRVPGELPRFGIPLGYPVFDVVKDAALLGGLPLGQTGLLSLLGNAKGRRAPRRSLSNSLSMATGNESVKNKRRT